MGHKTIVVLATALAIASGASVSYRRCEDGSLCPDRTTCCKTAAMTWSSCCPYEFAQCCQDGVHCCPSTYRCDIANGTCVHASKQERLFGAALEPVFPVSIGNRHRNEVSKADFVPCPDGSYCNDGQTCCLLSSGGYGCCPYAHAECCSDHASCCPEGYRCKVSTHQCVHATDNHTVAMVKKVQPVVLSPSTPTTKLNTELVRCPDGSYCNQGQTCCLLSSGRYGCCPYAHAECCSDHSSCCPEGYRCKVSTHQCVHATGNHTVAMVMKVQPVVPAPTSRATRDNAELVPCPDGSYCNQDQTCCLLTSGRYGCCPYMHAECCSDHSSCCPEGYRCKVSTHQCVHATGNHTVAMVKKVEPVVPAPRSSATGDNAELVPCPDGSYCNDGQTCCLLSSGGYGCCPYAYAECCSDHASCCPEGYRCRVSTHQCVHATGNHTVAMLKKVQPVVQAPRSPATRGSGELVRCPDGSYCNDGQTCCLLSSGGYGCCPYAHAECCSDHASCCPEGYRCRVSTHQCVHAAGNHTVAMVKKVQPVVLAPRTPSTRDNGELVRCPDGSYCNDGQTCCLLGSGGYGCCPYAHAECCSDHASCCPEGYRCRVSTHQCVHATGNHTVAMVKKVQPVVLAPRTLATGDNAELVPCPDGSYCNQGQTCCLLSSGRYGCCPYTHAECCSDHSSCCPEGYRCKVSTHQCVHATGNHTVAMVMKVQPVVLAPRSPATRGNAEFVPCPDGSYCNDGQTCCLLSSGGYGCCPYAHAECCSDHSSCCPEGYRCKVSTHQCVLAAGNHTVAMVKKVDPVVAAPKPPPTELPAEFVPCPDGSYCNDGQTCCLLSSGGYGCCPYAHAECCSDHSSCCPEGYRCKVSTHQCVLAAGNHTVAMVKKVDPVVAAPKPPPTELPAEFVPCPDGSYCNDGQTCCLLSSGGYGCCPYAHAECCSDHSSCCPEGYRCKVSTHQCVHATGNHTVAMVKKVHPVVAAPKPPPTELTELSVGNIRCPDGNYCYEGQTCCLLVSGQYGCCPYSHAECCSDHLGCCPEGYQCKVSTRQCVHASSNRTVAMVRKLDAIRPVEKKTTLSLNVGLLPCPDGSYCQNTQTCCLLTSGRYGCCPYSHAQCCSDHLSCCPEGYQCRVSTHQCVHATSYHSVAMAQKVDPVVAATRKFEADSSELSVGNIRCPDGSYCYDGQTCCGLPSGQYDCCPYSHAVCCSDYLTCCPHGYQCRTSTHECVRANGNRTVAMVRKFDAIRPVGKKATLSLNLGLLPCPDGSYCQNTQTCCLLTSGRYGCCPYSHAQCCSDHLSCCPEGYQCRVSTHQCVHATSNHSVAIAQKVDPIIPAHLRVSPGSDGRLIHCPDGKMCFNNQTCCELYDETYNCCPYVRATCCEDMFSCCPEGYRCIITLQKCVKDVTGETKPMHSLLSPSDSVTEQPVLTRDITCPDGHKCLTDQTCCQVTGGRYGCCPLPNAVCCEDHKSCCPAGYVCQVSTQTCQLGDRSVPMIQKVPGFKDAALIGPSQRNELSVMCPDGGECDDDQTCCQLKDGSYGCCIFNRAVCCDDKEHCCPEGYICDTAAGRCLNGNAVVPARLKVQARRRKPKLINLESMVQKTCPDKSFCPDKMTCCKSNSTYVCCPYREATCCSDGEHCCPKGFRCDEVYRRCVRERHLDEAPMSKEFVTALRP